MDCDDLVNIQFTSGTTGTPKGATLTHHNLVNHGNFLLADYADTNASILAQVPFFHSGGCSATFSFMLNHGASMVIPMPHFDPIAGLKALKDFPEINVVTGVPTMYTDMLTTMDQTGMDLGPVRQLIGFTGGSIVPIPLRRQFESRFPHFEFVVIYGTTENSPTSFMTTLNLPSKVKEETCGFPLPYTEGKIIDTNGRTIDRGQIGEICTRGYLVFDGYWNEPEKTSEVVDKQGWYHTGDLGYLTEEGALVVTGRSKEMIIRGGENIYPKEVEEVLLGMEPIVDAQVVGLPDDRVGEEVVAYIRVKSEITDEEIWSYLKKELTYFKIPKYIKRVDEYPLTASGKVQKFKLVEQAINDFK